MRVTSLMENRIRPREVYFHQGYGSDSEGRQRGGMISLGLTSRLHKRDTE